MDFEFDDLKREFLSEADGKLKEIRSKYEEGFPPRAEQLERMIYLAHQLKGAGGSYGFATISTESAELERELEVIRGGGSTDGLETRLSEHIERIAATIDASSRELAQKLS